MQGQQISFASSSMIGSPEDLRLREIMTYGFEDGGPHPQLDDVCSLARSVFQVPMALVTVVGEERQTFVGKCGIDEEGTPRSAAFCTYAIESDEVLIVTDARQDPRFAFNPLVTGAWGLRFYAGAPLILRPGIRLGSLCILDTVPRHLTEKEVAHLKLLAALVVRDFQHRQSLIDLRRERELLSQAARLAQVGSWSWDVRTGRIQWSPETSAVFGIEGSELPAREWADRHAASGTETIVSAVRKVMVDGQPFDVEMEVKTVNRGRRWIRCCGQPERSVEGRIVRVAGSVQDVTAEHRRAESLERLAYIDPLTGFPNRYGFKRSMEACLERAAEEGAHIGVLVLGLDRFRDVNEVLGHDVGDALLVAVASRLGGVVGDKGVVARLAGDEFAVMIGPMPNEGPLLTLSSELFRVVSQPLTLSGEAITCSVSIGSVLSSPSDTPPQLLKSAEIAMHQARKSGRGRLKRYEPVLRQAAEERSKRFREAREGLQHNQFRMHYQPIVTLDGGPRVVGYEALLRWQHPVDGLVGPAALVTALQDEALGRAIGDWVLHDVLRQMRSWQDSGFPYGRIAVNLGSAQFAAPGLADTIKGGLDRWRVPSDALCLEITEDVVLASAADGAMDTIQALHAMGIALALDDFGTGYASLAQLRQLPVSRLKVDKSFVQSSDVSILRAVIGLGTSLDIEVVAEGVETAEQATLVRRLGCPLAQGFLFSAAVPADVLPAVVAQIERGGACERPLALLESATASKP